MASLGLTMPLPDGSAEAVRDFGRQIEARRAEHTESRRRLGVTKEMGWIQPTPMGSLFNLLLEGEDPAKANVEFAGSTEPYDLWFKETGGPLLNVDLGMPFPILPESLYVSVPEGPGAGKQHLVMAVPLVAGKTGAYREMATEVGGPRRAEMDAFHDRAGIAENWWLEETPMGDFAVVYLQGEDVLASTGKLAASREPFELWFKERLLETQGIDWGKPPEFEVPEMVLNWVDEG